MASKTTISSSIPLATERAAFARNGGAGAMCTARASASVRARIRRQASMRTSGSSHRESRTARRMRPGRASMQCAADRTPPRARPKPASGSSRTSSTWFATPNHRFSAPTLLRWLQSALRDYRSQSFEGTFELGRKGRFDVDRRGRHGMGKANAEGVQKHAVQIELLAEEAIVHALAVTDITDDGTADVLEVSTNLVQAAGRWPRLDQAIASEDFQAGKGGLCWNAGLVAIFARRKRMIDDAIFRGDRTNERQVRFFDRRRGKELAKRARHVGRKREHQDAARATVEAVHRKDVRPDGIAHAGHGDVSLGRPAAVNRQAGRLIRNDQVIVTPKNA